MPTHLYVTTDTADGGICHYLSDGRKMTPAGYTPLGDHVTYLAVEGETMYALLRAPAATKPYSALVTLPILPDGSLGAPTPPVSTLGEDACHLSVRAGRAYGVNYMDGTVFAVSASGDVPPVLVRSGAPEGDRSRTRYPSRQLSSHAHCARLFPDGDRLAVTDLGADTLTVYDLSLRPLSVTRLPLGTGPRHTVFSPDGRFLYCANELASSLSVFYVADDGLLSPLYSYSTLPDGYKGESYPGAVRFHDGEVWVSNRGHDSLAVFPLRDGMPAAPRFVPLAGHWPRDFDFVGDSPVVCAELSDRLLLLAPDGTTLDVAEVPHPYCVMVR